MPIPLILTIAILLAWCGPTGAQDPFGGGQAADPFGGAGGTQPADPFGGAAPAGGQVADPFGGGAPAAPAAAQPKSTDEPLTVGEDQADPVILAIRDMNPTTPQDLMFAVQTLFDVGHREEAKQYLQRLLATDPNRDQLEAMYDEYGGSFFFRLSRDPQVQPEGAQLGQAVRDAAYQASREPERLRGLVRQLSDASDATRRHALQDLLRAGDAAIGPLLDALGDSGRAAEHPQVRDAFLAFGDSVIEPLLGALEAPNTTLRAQVITVLGRIGTSRAIAPLVTPALTEQQPAEVRQAARDALVRIVGAVPSRYEAARYLQRRTQAYLEGGALAAAPDYEGLTTIWRWDQQQQTVVPHRYPPAEASRMLAARLARQLIQLAPDNTDYQRLYLVTNLTDAKIRAGIDQPLPQGPDTMHAQAVQAGAASIEDVLAYAMQHEHIPAAIAAAEVLGSLGDEALLRSDDGRPRPLALALRYGDRRLRLAAADAIMQIDPQRAYPGSSYLPETLGYLIRTTGTRRALVSHPRVEKAQTLVGMLNRLGFEADAATSGKETFRLASTNPDYEFVLISDAVDFPAADETIQAFRKDPRTSSLPVGLMMREHNLQRARSLAAADPLVEAFPRPHNEETMTFQVSRLLELAGHQAATHDQRVRHAQRALEHLLYLAENAQQLPFYDLYRQREAITSALFTPQLAVPAARVLGLLGSPDAQRSLVTLASQHARPLAERQAAANAFEQAVSQHGLLLTRDEILLQYERYNQSASLDSGTQQVLGSILDTIERPGQQASATTAPAGANLEARDG
jgi:HEAT repeat protein